MTVLTESAPATARPAATGAKPRVLSGIQPSGNFHLGNYLGAIRNWANQQDMYDNFFCIVDLHALSVEPSQAEMQSNIVNVANAVLAGGVDPERSVFFVQSDVREHAELCWLLQSVTRFGELTRMTQFKDKSRGKDDDGIPAVVFTYPVLMAADIIVYDAAKVPVGDDQRQHVELTRDIAWRFNKRYGETFVIPEADIKDTGARIMSLTDPTSKMSKSDPNPNSYIGLSDEPDVIRKKIKRAVTDSGSDVVYAEDKPALRNLIGIYSLLAEKPVADIEAMYTGKGYGAFKTDLAEVVVEAISPIQQRLKELEANPEITANVLRDGAEKARAVAAKKMELVRERMGIGAPH